MQLTQYHLRLNFWLNHVCIMMFMMGSHTLIAKHSLLNILVIYIFETNFTIGLSGSYSVSDKPSSVSPEIVPNDEWYLETIIPTKISPTPTT